MASSRSKVDKPFLVISVILIVAGFFIFNSASLGLLARDSSAYSSISFSQTILGFFLGTIALIVVSKLDFKIWKRWALVLLVIAIILNILVLIPSIGFEHAGAQRWIRIGSISLQTSEILKLAFVIYFAAWASVVKDKIKTFKTGFLPLLILFAICAGLLLSQPDTDNLMMIFFAGIAMFIAAGGRWRFVFLTIMTLLLGLALLAFMKP